MYGTHSWKAYALSVSCSPPGCESGLAGTQALNSKQLNLQKEKIAFHIKLSVGSEY